MKISSMITIAATIGFLMFISKFPAFSEEKNDAKEGTEKLASIDLLNKDNISKFEFDEGSRWTAKNNTLIFTSKVPEVISLIQFGDKFDESITSFSVKVIFEASEIKELGMGLTGHFRMSTLHPKNKKKHELYLVVHENRAVFWVNGEKKNLFDSGGTISKSWGGVFKIGVSGNDSKKEKKVVFSKIEYKELPPEDAKKMVFSKIELLELEDGKKKK